MSSTLIAQLSDLHLLEPGRMLYGRIDVESRLEAAIDAILALPEAPDAVLATGDLVESGRIAQYRNLGARLARLPMPVYLLPGNHDDRAALREAFPALAARCAPSPDGFVQYAFDVGPMRVIALDTSVPGRSHGELCDARLDWLAAELERAAGAPVLIAMHHPPFDSLIGWMDRDGLRAGRERLGSIVSRHPNVERIVCGHLHRAIDARFAGTIASTAPAPAHQIAMELRPDGEHCWTMEPGGWRLHAWTPATGVVSHLGFAGTFDGPHRFRG
jgi:3',5'-cyclic AMP phosphodiesterase CpdA